MPRKRLLVLAEGATMLHFVRPLAITSGLDPRRYETHFFAPARFSAHLENTPFEVGILETMPGERFLENLARGAPLFPADVLRKYVAEDRRLIRAIKPDLVIGDMRLSLPISAQLEGVRSAVVINGYWSPFARRRQILPEVPITRLLPPRILGGVYRLTEPLAYAVHARGINLIRREFGLAPLPADPRHLYSDGDHVLYADVPEFVPTTGVPRHHRYIGPCNWEMPAAKPAWWGRMLNDPRPKVFVSLGSSGPVRILPTLLAVLSKLPVAVVLSTSGRASPPERPGLYVAGLLPFSETSAAASLVISHGGSGGLYPAMAAGTPVLAIPSNADQHLSAAALEDSGAGLSVRVEEATAKRLAAAIERLLSAPGYTESARRWKGVYSRYDSPALFGEFLDETLGPV